MIDTTATSMGDKMEKHPFPAKLVRTFASSASQIESLARELVDNSLDADADHIEITVEEGTGDMKGFVGGMIVADNGKGMSISGAVDELFNSYTFSADKKYDTDVNGKYGWGGTKVALAFAQYKETYTRTEDSGLRGRRYDMDAINEAGEWGSIPIEDTTTLQYCWSKLWKGSAPTTGTAIHLTGFDKSVAGDNNVRTKKQFKHSVNVIRHTLSEIHRKPIEAGVRIVVNGEILTAACPIGSDIKGASLSEWENIEINGQVVGKLRTCSLYNCETKALSARFKEGRIEQHCGYAFTRNHTLVTKSILKGDQGWQQKPTRHPNNRFAFVQVEFPPTSDHFFGLQNTRDQVAVDAQIQQIIHAMTKDFFTLEQKKAQGLSSKKQLGKTKALLTDGVNTANDKFVKPSTLGRTKWVKSVKMKAMGASGATWAYDAVSKNMFLNTDNGFIRHYFYNTGTSNTRAQEVIIKQSIAFESCLLEMNEMLDDKLEEQLRASFFTKLRMVVDA